MSCIRKCAIERILAHLGQPTAVPAARPPRAPPLAWADDDEVRIDNKGSDLLDTYIALHFAEQVQFGRYSVLTREGARHGG